MADSPREVDVVEWQADFEPAVVDVLSRAFATNPVHLAAFGAESVVACNAIFFRAALSILRGRRLVATRGSAVVGFAHWIDSPGCRFSFGQRLWLVPEMLRGFGPSATIRVGKWLSTWALHDPVGLHCHFGPIGVAPEAQGQGVGRRLMDVFCATLDERRATGFLETDKPDNVVFYERRGFEVIEEVEVIGATTYFMTRASKGAA